MALNELVFVLLQKGYWRWVVHGEAGMAAVVVGFGFDGLVSVGSGLLVAGFLMD